MHLVNGAQFLNTTSLSLSSVPFVVSSASSPNPIIVILPLASVYAAQ